jgi:hypothetical protein
MKVPSENQNSPALTAPVNRRPDVVISRSRVKEVRRTGEELPVTFQNPVYVGLYKSHDITLSIPLSTEKMVESIF